MLSCLLFGVFLTGYLLVLHETSWRIPASSPGAVAFGPGYLPMEYTDFFGDRLWFRHVRNQTPMGIPDLATPQIVTLHVLTRNDEPPRTIQLQSDNPADSTTIMAHSFICTGQHAVHRDI